MKTFIIGSLFILCLAFSSSQEKKHNDLPAYDKFKFQIKKQIPAIFGNNKQAQKLTKPKQRTRFSSTFDPVLANRLQKTLDAGRVANNVIGGSAAIITPRQGTWLGASGFSDPVNNDSIDVDMLFGIGSISKSFCATMILQLQQEGALSVHDSLHKYLPHYPNVDDYTIRLSHSLQMTSGIFDYFNDGPSAINECFTNPGTYWTPSHVCSTYVFAPNFSPGTGWKYSNTNYLLLGMIVTNLSQTNYSTQLHNRICTPLGLQHTYFCIEDSLVGNIAHEWSDLNDDGVLEDYYASNPRTAFYSMAYTAGAIFSTAEDIAKWGNALLTGQVLSASSMQQMLNFHPTSGYGFGIYKISQLGRELWGHNGGTAGYVSNMFYSPVDSTTIVLLTNQRGSPDPIWVPLLNEIMKYRTPKPYVQVTPAPISFPNIDINTSLRETTFTVTNNGFMSDSISILINYRTVVPESAFTVVPLSFILAPDSSAVVTVRIKPNFLTSNITYLPQVIASSINGSDTVTVSNAIRFKITGTLTGSKELPTLPNEFSLEQNYLNPFNPTTALRFELPKVSIVSLTIYNTVGEKIMTLLHNANFQAGKQEILFDGSNLTSGIYFYRLSVNNGEYVETKKLMLLK